MPDPRKSCLDKCSRKLEIIDSPKLSGVGPSRVKIMFVGEAPGQTEDEEGVPFIGTSGQVLSDVLNELGFDRDKAYITNAVKCATTDQNQKPQKKEITCCRPFLAEEIARVNPNVICCLGGVAMEAVLKRSGITKLKNNVFKSKEFKTKVVPVFHPAYILRNPSAYTDFYKGIELAIAESKKKGPVTQGDIKTKHMDAAKPAQIDKVLTALEGVDAFVYDLETTSLDYRVAKILCIALSWQIGLGVTIQWDSFSDEQMDRLKKIFLSKKLKIGHNLKYDIHVIRANGVKVRGPYFDTLPAMALVDENVRDKGLEALTLRYTNIGEYWQPLDEYKKQYCKENKLKLEDFNYGMIPYEILVEYAQYDADVTYRLYKLFTKEMKRQNLYEFFLKYTIPFFRIILKMEYKGIAVDREQLMGLANEYKQQVEDTRKEIFDNPTVKKYNKIKTKRASKVLIDKWEDSKVLKGRYDKSEAYVAARIKPIDTTFNPGSTLQLREVLYDILRLPVAKKTDKGSPSTDEETLNFLARDHDVDLCKQILNHRKVTKFLATYIESTYEKSAIDGRIHPSYLQHRAVTGRLSSANPNFQNIPRDAKDFKACFLADPGMTIVKADLAQAEFRCWAHYSADEDMISDIESGMDIHRKTASEVFGITEDEVTKDQRTAAKNCVFGLMYGRGTRAISMQYGISEDAATEVRNLFFDKYPSAALWLDKQVHQAREFGYVKTWMGRIRRLPEINSDDHMVKSEAERQAKNSPIQGLASDMNNHFMVTNMRTAHKEGIKCFPMATVHDANFIQVVDAQVEQLAHMMMRVVDIAFPKFLCKMALDFEIGKTLGTLEEVNYG